MKWKQCKSVGCDDLRLINKKWNGIPFGRRSRSDDIQYPQAILSNDSINLSKQSYSFDFLFEPTGVVDW